MSKYLAAAAAAGSIFISACSVTGGGYRTPPEAGNQTRLETRVFYGPCVRPTNKTIMEAFSIGEVFGGAIISNTLGRVGKALRKAGEAEPHPESAFRNLEIRPNTTEPCVQFVKGRFGQTAQPGLRSLFFLKDAVEMEGETAAKAEEVARLTVTNNLRNAGIHLQSDPVFFFEGRLRLSANKAALSLVPSFYTYRSPLKTGRRANSVYGMLMSVSFHRPGKAADSNEASGTSLALGALQPGEATHRVYRLPEEGKPSPNETPWFPSFVKALVVASNTPSRKHAPEASDSANAKKSKTTPMILSATVTETRKANEVILFFADVFDASQAKLQTELEEKFIKSTGDAADLAGYTAEQNKLVDYYTKFAAAETSRATLCALSADASSTETGRFAATAALFGAQSAANVAALAASLPAPYPTLVEVTGERLECSS